MKVSLITLLLTSSCMSPAITALAKEGTEEKVSSKKEPVKEVKEEKEDTEDSTDEGGKEDKTKAELSGEIGMDLDTAKTLHSEIQKTLITLGGTGEAISAQFTKETKKADNVKLYNKIIVTQLELYELLFKTTIDASLNAPVTASMLEEGVEITDLKHYLTAYNIINKYLDTQIDALEAEDKHDKNLVAALEAAKIDTSVFQDKKISKSKPLDTKSLRASMQTAINAATPAALSALLKYMNGGKDSKDTDTLTNAETKESTKDVIALIKQWEALPHIKKATDGMKLLKIAEGNQDWLVALESLSDSMESDNGGDTDADKATKDDVTNPELATSALGKMGSSLFTVSRSAHADDTLSKPLTNTLGWVISDELKNKKTATTDPGPAAKDDFLAMFAATSVYTPFLSKIGDKDYAEAYKSLFKDSPEQVKDDDELVVFEGNALGPIDILNQVQNLKKPLYFYNDLNPLGAPTVFGYSVGVPKGVASLLTVGDLIETIKRKKDLAAVTMNGVMEKDGDSWAFYNYSLNDGVTESAAPASTEEKKSDENTVVAGSSDSAGAPILNKISADKSVNGGQDSTRVLFEMTYNEKNPGAALLTGALMHNIYNDTVLKSKFKERISEAVYIDAIGNIVLNDGLVVLPAAANPTYWAVPNGLTGTGLEDETWTYNPFTVAFMDTYPAIYQGGSAPSSVNQKKDKNKYILSGFNVATSGFLVAPLEKGFKNTFAVSRTAGLFKKFKVDGSEKPEEGLVKPLTNEIKVGNSKTVKESWYNVGAANPLQMKNFISADGDSVFPYLTSKVIDPEGQAAFDSKTLNYTSSILIAKNMYAYLIGEIDKAGNVTAANGKSSGGSAKEVIREGFLFNNVTMPVLTGVTSGIEFDKTNAKSDLLQAGGDANVLEKWIINFSKWLAVTSKDAKNILAIASADDVSLLKVLYGVFIDYGYYIVFVCFMVLVVIFLREGDFMAAAIKGGVLSSLLFTALFLLPLMVPWVTGWTAAPLTKGTVLNTLMTKLEINDKVNEVAVAGQSGLSVKLYNLSPKQAKDLNEKNSYTEGNYLTNEFSINDSLGMYVKGTELRLDLYSFWRFDPLIIATKDNVQDPNDKVDSPQIYHSDHSSSKYIADNEQVKTDMGYNNDLVDYYMPFNLLEDGFMKTLNNYLTVYNPPQSVVRYPDGLVKSSYVLNTYMKSLAFLAAEPNIAKLISSAKEEKEYAHRGLSAAEVAVVNERFYPYGDILNLQTWVDTEWEDLSENYANAVWTQSMLDSGYYSPGSGIEKRLQLANKVNRKAYDTIIQMKDTKGLVSDESLIKLVAMYATFEWNKEISYMSHNQYPQSPTLNEISSSDILSATVLGQSKQFMFYDTSVVSNVFTEKGMLGVIAVDIILVVLAIYSILLSWILPIIIVGLIFYSAYLILTNKRVMPALMFALKLTMIAVIMNLALTLVIVLYKFYDSIYVLTLGLLLVVIVFVMLLWKQFFSKKSRLDGSWQRKHINSIGGPGSSTGGNSREMQDYLRESGGVNGRRGTQTSRYDD